MKRTEKNRDSYEQDKEYQNQQQRQQHARYQQQRYTNQQQAQYQNNGDRYRQQQARYDENGNRYYNDRDFRREQQLEEDNIRQKSLKMVIYYHRPAFNCRCRVCDTCIYGWR